MKNKEIKAHIKNHASQDIPDVYSRIDLTHITIRPKEQFSVKNKWPNILKISLISAMFFLAAFISLQIIKIPDSLPLASDEELLGFQLVSAYALIEFSQTDLGAPDATSGSLLLKQSQATEMSDYLDDIKPFIQVSELIVNSKKNIGIARENSDLDLYAYKINYQTYSLTNQIMKYEIYYNLFQNNTIEGIVKQDSSSLEFVKNNNYLRLYQNANQHVQVKINEGTKQSFNYTMINNNQEIFESDIEIFQESKGYGVSISLTKGEHSYSMKIHRNNQSEIGVEYQVADSGKNKQLKGKFNVGVEQVSEVPENYQYRFSFDDQSQTTHPRCRGNSTHC